MATIQTINNGESGLDVRGKINSNFTAVNTDLATNAANIATNTADIATNAANITDNRYTDYIQVKNQTGVLIPKGTPLTYVGADAGIPLVKPATADTISNARVIAVASQDMPNSLTTIYDAVREGKITSMNTALLTQGLPVYVDVDGTLTNTMPQIASQVGGSVFTDAAGTFYVKIENLINLPTIGAFMKGYTVGNNVYTVNDTTPIIVDDYDTKYELVMTGVRATGKITAPLNGIYQGAFKMNGVSSVNNKSMYALVYVNDVEVDRFIFDASIDGNKGAVSFSSPVNLTANDVVDIRLLSTSGSFTWTLDSVDFSLYSLQYRT